MNLLLDTNIILNLLRAKDFTAAKKFINPQDGLLYISIVSEAEINSLAIRNNWGLNRLKFLNSFLNTVSIIDVNKLSVRIYAEIDAFSQRLNPDFENYTFDTPRNMGKNDLWIASLAAMLDLTLITTDADFDHLNGIFFNVKKIRAADFLPFSK
jgi:tRNA(fMet)-specific endonuclease VapC